MKKTITKNQLIIKFLLENLLTTGHALDSENLRFRRKLCTRWKAKPKFRQIMLKAQVREDLIPRPISRRKTSWSLSKKSISQENLSATTFLVIFLSIL
jgi:hypothetical protein